MSVSENRKDKLAQDLTRFYKCKGISWTAPRYSRVEKLPFIPTETEVDQLISGLGTKTACFLQLLKDTGMRAGEAWKRRHLCENPKRRKLSFFHFHGLRWALEEPQKGLLSNRETWRLRNYVDRVVIEFEAKKGKLGLTDMNKVWKQAFS